MGTPIKRNLMVTAVILLQKKEKCGKNQPYFPLNGACWSTAVHLVSKIHLSPMLARRRERAQVQLSFTSHTV